MSFPRWVACWAVLGLSSTALGGPLNYEFALRPDLLPATAEPLLRDHRAVAWRPPAERAAAWARFLALEGPGWRASFDRTTGVPSRVFGAGIAAPGAVASPEAAARFARAFLARHVELFAPGARADDFALVANDLDAGLRTVGFEQRLGGLRVLWGRVSFRFKNDRLFVIASDAVPVPAGALARSSTALLPAAALRAAAARWLEAHLGAPAVAEEAKAPVLLPLVSPGGAVRFARVVPVTTRSVGRAAAFEVFVDAESGAPVARRGLYRYATGAILYRVPERFPGAGRKDYPAAGAQVAVDGMPATVDTAGQVSWSGTASAQVTLGAVSSLVKVVNRAGAAFADVITLTDGGQVVVDRSADELLEAQLATFIHASIAKAWARKVTGGEMPWLDEPLEAVVNLDEACNAYSDGTNIHFMKSGSTQGVTCENTGLLADVVYHEFGHSFHAHAIIPGVGDWGDGSLGEGVGDYLAATITGDPGMGRGFFRNDQALRHVDDRDLIWPDDIHPDIHETGLIFAGAMWDLRKLLIQAHGEKAGVARADWLFYQAIRRATDIPSTYVEILAADDDDGNLENGTPNACLIHDAFARHGLASPDAPGAPGVGRPVLDGRTLSLEVKPVSCPGAAVASATIRWERRGTGDAGEVAMTPGGPGWIGQLPQVPAGTVLRYQVEVALESGTTLRYPDNAADPMYEQFVGAVQPIYCTDFEGDAAPAGWTHGLLRGDAGEGADDWQWGEPQGTSGSGDPAAAFSGTKVYGNDLGGGEYNGKYQPEKTNWLASPVIHVAGYEGIRLHYRRWLHVEDGVYDQASIYVNGQKAWSNAATDESNGKLHHQDREWRFHDVDLSPFLQDGRVQVRFELASDGGAEFGGWTIDDFCIVALSGEPVCEPLDPSCDPPDEGPAGCGCRVGGRPRAAANGGVLGTALLSAALLVLRRRLSSRRAARASSAPSRASRA